MPSLRQQNKGADTGGYRASVLYYARLSFTIVRLLLSVESLQSFSDRPLAFISEVKANVQPIDFTVHTFPSAFNCASARYSYPFAAAQMSSMNFTRSALNLLKFFTRHPPPPVIYSITVLSS